MDDLRLQNYASTPVKESVKSLLGAALSADWRQAFIARGYGWHADEGAFSTPAAGGGATAVIDQDRPNLLISVGSGYTLIPTRLFCAAQIPLLAADSDESEILFAVDVAAAAAGLTGNGTQVTPVNMRTQASGNPSCPAQVWKTMSGNITNPTLGLELGHAVVVGDVQGTAATTMWTPLSLLYEPQNPPFLVGPCAIYCYHGGTTATTGFTNADFLVIPTSLISGLT